MVIDDLKDYDLDFNTKLFFYLKPIRVISYVEFYLMIRNQIGFKRSLMAAKNRGSRICCDNFLEFLHNNKFIDLLLIKTVVEPDTDDFILYHEDVYRTETRDINGRGGLDINYKLIKYREILLENYPGVVGRDDRGRPILGKAPATERKASIDPNEAVRKLLYTNSEGKHYLPSQQLLASMTSAGSQLKAGGKATYKAAFGAGAIGIETHNLIFPEAEQGWDVDIRPVNANSGTAKKTKIVATRPIFPEWSVEFEMYFDEEVVQDQVVRQALDIAGWRYGVGAFRPECKGSFGQFRVDHFELLPLKTAE